MNFVKAKGLALIDISALFLIFFSPFPTSAENGFTQKDRELLIELRVRMGEIDKSLDGRQRRS